MSENRTLERFGIMGLARRVAHVGEKRHACKILVVKPVEKMHLGNTGDDLEDSIKSTQKK